MKILPLHSWALTSKEARHVQHELASRVSHVNQIPARPRYVAATDNSSARRGEEARGAVVVLSYPNLELIEVRTARGRPPMPYVPGLLSFREIPILLDAFGQLVTTPDLILVDGHGLAHPRRFGMACHLGVLLDLPTIGCAKSILVGTHGSLGVARGSRADLTHGGEVIGAAVTTRQGVTPVYTSIGHQVDLPAAIHWVLQCTTRYRLPEPTRLAHQAASGHVPPGLR